MNTKISANINRFGKVGKTILSILLVVAIASALLSGIAAVYSATLPKDAVLVKVTNQAEFRINGSIFSSVWDSLTKGVAYASGEDPSATWEDDANGKSLPPEDTELDTELDFFNQSYSSAQIHSEGSDKIIEAKSDPAEYSTSNLTIVFVFAALFAASAAASILLLKKLFQVLSVCESPFCLEFVAKLRAFGYSLLPVAVIASIGETLAVRFLSAGKGGHVSIQWGLLISFAVIMCLVTVFRYGVQLQKESDEML